MKLLNVSVIALAFLFCADSAAFAQTAGVPSYKAVGAGLGAGLAVLGLGLGLGRIGGSALESMARQPEVSDRIAQNMITVAALLEGAGIIALVICLLGLFFG